MVDEIYDVSAAAIMGIKSIGQVCIMIHCGSRGLGHQVASDFINMLSTDLDKSSTVLNDPQLAYVSLSQKIGQDYLEAMNGAANYAFVNRSIIAYNVRNCFEEVFKVSPKSLDMYLIYDVAHNIASVEEHVINGEKKKLLVHRKGSTKALPRHHRNLPSKYLEIGQPVMVGGSMGTFRY